MQVPWELAGQSQAMVTGTLGAPIPNPQLMSIAPFAPGIFTLNGAGSSMAPFAPALFVLNDTNPSQALVTIAGAQGFGPPSGGVGTPVAPFTARAWERFPTNRQQERPLKPTRSRLPPQHPQ